MSNKKAVFSVIEILVAEDKFRNDNDTTITTTINNDKNKNLLHSTIDFLKEFFYKLENSVPKSTVSSKESSIVSKKSDNFENKSITTTLASVSTSTLTPISLNNFKVCVKLSPSHVSTRRSNNVRYKCKAIICDEDDIYYNEDSNDDDDDNFPDYNYKQFVKQLKSILPRFERPIFIWKTTSKELKSSNGSCNNANIDCQDFLDINMVEISKEMLNNGLTEMKITCSLESFIHLNGPSKNNFEFQYVSGQADGLIKLFKGKSINQPCNQTDECGENMVCNPSSNNIENLSLENKTFNYGHCECPIEQIQISNNDSNSNNKNHNNGNRIHLSSYTIVKDYDYDEMICVPKKSLNESCKYDEQCSTMNPNSYCRTIFSSNGLIPIDSVCDCSFAYVQINGECISVYSAPDINADESKMNMPKYFWFTRRPRVQMSETERVAWTYRFLWQRYLHQSYMLQLLIIFMLFIPFLIWFVSSIYFQYYSKIMGKRRYQPPSRTSNHTNLHFDSNNSQQSDYNEQPIRIASMTNVLMEPPPIYSNKSKSNNDLKSVENNLY